jgi:hypothetical protein
MLLSKRGRESKLLRRSEKGSLPLTESGPAGGLILSDAHKKRDQRKARWARAVFHSVLAIDLKARGAGTTDQLYHRLSWFMLPFERDEIDQILESARRNGIIRLLGDAVDALGNPVTGEWVLTEAGQKLKRPRALALPDLGRGALGSSAGFSTAFTSVKGLLLGAAPYLGIYLGVKFDVAEVTKLTLVAVGALILGTVLVNGMIGDLKLREAARSWPRMQEKRHARYLYQLSLARLAFIPAMMIVVYLTGAAGLLLGADWWWIVGVAVVELLIAVLVYLGCLRSLRRAWSANDKDLLSWEQKWRLRGPWEPPVPPQKSRSIPA